MVPVFVLDVQREHLVSCYQQRSGRQSFRQCRRKRAENRDGRTQDRPETFYSYAHCGSTRHEDRTPYHVGCRECHLPDRADRRSPGNVGPGSRRGGDRRRCDRAARGDRRAGSRRVGHPGRSRKGHRRPRDYQRRQRGARWRHQGTAEVRHRGFARSGVPRPHRLVGGPAQRLPRLSLQRSRGHSRFRRSQRARLRLAGRARRGVRRPGARYSGRDFGRKFGASRNALLRDGLALGPDRPGRAPVARHGLHHGQRVDAPARGRREKGWGCCCCSNTA